MTPEGPAKCSPTHAAGGSTHGSRAGRVVVVDIVMRQSCAESARLPGLEADHETSELQRDRPQVAD